ncbi:MAG TPA: HEPN domain-containing protein [Candidatus Kapabacteria bacterium]|nr:HEPN domain-containing protein [Candidatus Kapabacteria bacterium]
MKESFRNRAIENLEAAELLFENGKYNASANRAYYAAFHSAIAAVYCAGINPTIDHKSIHTLFSDYYFNRRKIINSKYKGFLSDLQDKEIMPITDLELVRKYPSNN